LNARGRLSLETVGGFLRHSHGVSHRVSRHHAGLEDILNDYGDDGELRDLIEFMRYAATRLDEEPAGGGLHEEFQHWQ